MKLLFSCFLSLTLAFSQSTLAFDKPADRSANTEIQKNFDLEGIDKVQLENKFGQIIITDSETQTLNLKALVRVSGRKQDQVDDLMERLEIEDDKFSGRLMIKSELDEESSLWKSFLKKIGNEVSGAKITVDIEVSMPSDMELDITSKYGEIVIPDWKASCRLDISHAELNAKSFEHLDLSLKASDFQIGSIASGDLNIKNSDGEIHKILDGRINSGSSEIEIDSVQTLHLDSKNDKYLLHEVGELSGTTLFAKIKVNQLDQSAQLNMNFGYLHLRSISSSFDLIDCKSKLTDYEINLTKEHSVGFDIRAFEKGFIIDDKYWGADWEWVNEKEKYILLTGSKHESPKSKIQINAERGDVKVRLDQE